MRSGCLLLFVVVLLGGIPAFSQNENEDPPGVAMGIDPQGTYHGGDFDAVDMSTGRLNLRIPLVVDKSQRGDLNFTYSITYASTGIWIKFSDSGLPGTFTLQPPRYSVSSPGLDAESWLFPVDSDFTENATTANDDYVYWIPEDGEFGGPIHPFGETETIDGSGITVPTTAPGATNRRGIQFLYDNNGNFLYVEDTNGNKMSSANGDFSDITDTLGRYWSVSSFSSDVTGCPAGGPVAPAISYTWTIPGPANGVRVFKFCYSDYNIVASMQGYPYDNPNNTAVLMTGLVLPDGTTWRFDYDNNSFADLIAVYTPTGGSIQYTWTTAYGESCYSSNDVGLRVISTRTVNDGINSPQQWTYSISGSLDQGGGTVRDPLGNDTVYTAQCEGPITQVKYYLGHSDTGQLLKTENKGYRYLPNPYPRDGGPAYTPGSPLLQTLTTVWPNGQQNQVHLGYDSFTYTDSNPDNPPPSTYTSSLGLVTSETHSDYGSGSPGPIISARNTSYKALSDPNYLNANILDLPTSVVITDGNGNKCAETDYGYDAPAQIGVSSGIGTSQQHMGPPTPGVLGNLTSITRQLFNNPCSSPNPSSTLLATNRYVYDTGMLQKSVDPLNNSTTYAYSTSYWGAYLTTVTNTLGQQSSYGYDFNTGFLKSAADLNGQTTQYSPDCMLRPLSITYPDGGQEGVTYNYNGGIGCTGTYGLTYIGATHTKKITSSQTFSQTSVFDGLGRLVQTQSSVPTSTCASGYVYIDTGYDANERKHTVSNPDCTSSASDDINTTYSYDSLNRATSVTEQDGSAATTDYSQFPCLTVSDEALKARKSCMDGAGRTTSVSEDPLGLNYQTNYTYNANNNLLSVVQSGSRQRTFSYDSLSRLLSATNPESGTIGYTYDANGNLATKVAPQANQTGSVTTTTSYCYDALNRLTAKKYVAATCPVSSPDLSYSYDGATCPTGQTCFNVGHRTGMNDAAGSEAWSYYYVSGTGDGVTDQRTTNNVTKFTVYDSNFDGTPASITYPSGHTVTYGVNVAEQPTSVIDNTDSSHPINYLSTALYTPHGGLTSASYGPNSIVATWLYNVRLQPCRIAVNATGTAPSLCGDSNGGNRLDFAYNFNLGSDNGNVVGITNGLDSMRSQAFSYDTLNRLLTAQTTSTYSNSPTRCWGESYQYDNQANGGAWGNLTGIGASSSSYNGCEQENLNLLIGSNNQITTSGYGYDAAGNLISAPPAGTTYSYNAENQLAQVTGFFAAGYLYDGDGKRVAKTSGGTAYKLYWYGMNDAPLAESDGSGNVTDEYIFFNGKRIARRVVQGQ